MPVTTNANATSNRTRLQYIPEVTFGTTPATPAFKELRYTGESLNYDVTMVTSKEIRSDRNTANLVPVKAGSAGDVQFELSTKSFDDFIEAAMCSTWGAATAGVSSIKNGTTLKSFTVQKHFQDASPALYHTFVGQRVASMSLDFKTGAILTGKFGLMGLGATLSSTVITGQTFVANPDNESPMNAVSDIQSIKDNGVTSTMNFKSITLELNNALRAQEAVGSLTPIGIALGTLDLTGSVEAYFSDMTLYNRYVNSTGFALEFLAQDSEGSYYKFTLPKVKIESSKILSGGGDQDVMMSATWRAIYDPTALCMIQIERKVV